jgi:hypothetical protein
MRTLFRLGLAPIALCASWLVSTPSALAAEEPDSATDVWIHLDAPAGTVLEQVKSGGGWEPVCVTPCDRYLPTSPSYRVNSLWILASGGFSLQGSPQERQTIFVHPAYVPLRVFGTVVATVGVVVTCAGLLLTAFVLPLWAVDGFRPYETNELINLPGLVGVGAATIGIGAVPLIGGVLLLAGKTTVTQGPAPRDAGQAWDALLTPSTRTPSWTRPRELAMAPAVVSVPLFAGRF